MRIRLFVAGLAVLATATGLFAGAFTGGGDEATPARAASVSGQPASAHHPADAAKPSPATLVLHDGMRKLWEDHITWTRLFIVSDVAGLPDTGDTAGRLLQNQQDIGDAIAPYYGEAAGAQLTALLRDHILVAADILAAAKAGDQPAVDAAVARWYANADDIAAFLSSANPANWPLADMQSMMHTHLDLTLQEAVAQLQGNYSSSIALYDQVHAEILEMSDMLSDGIAAQFPKQVKK